MGKVVIVNLPTLAFHEVETSGAIRLEYTQDSTYSVQVYGNEKAIEAYTITSEDEELVASLKEGTGTINKNTPAITLRITAPFITEIQASGASDNIRQNLREDFFRETLPEFALQMQKLNISIEEVKNALQILQAKE